MLRALALALALQSQPAPPGVALRGLDPVELCDGRETPGIPLLDARWANYSYCFANEANRRRFRSDPARFAIQLGGGCGAMGPLSGSGNPDRFAVHDGRIYIFASDGCRKSFLASPATFLEGDDPEPSGDADSAAKAKILLDKAASSLGGAVAIGKLRAYRETGSHTVDVGGKSYRAGREFTWIPPFEMRDEQWWEGSRWSDVLTRDGGFFVGGKAPRDADESQRCAMRRNLARHPLVILRARAGEGFRAFAATPGRVGETPVERVTVHFDRTTSVLALDPESGRLVAISYRGRFGIGAVRQVEVRLGEYRRVGPFTLPHSREVWLDGTKAPDPPPPIERIEIDPTLDPSVLRR